MQPSTPSTIAISGQVRKPNSRNAASTPLCRLGIVQPLRSVTTTRAVRFRDIVMTGGARHGAQLAVAYGLPSAVLGPALGRFGRALLTDLARGELRAKFETELQRQLPEAWPGEG